MLGSVNDYNVGRVLDDSYSDLVGVLIEKYGTYEGVDSS